MAHNSNSNAGPVSGARTGAAPGAGGHANAPTQAPNVMRENKTNANSKGEIQFGVAPKGVRSTGKGCC